MISTINKITAPIIKPAEKVLEKPMHWLANTKLSNVIGDKYVSNSTKFISGVGVTSIVLKDAFGCYLYVKQSLNNKKIPDEKRKFVAALDLANGTLMLAAQLGMFFTISSKTMQSKLFKNMYNKHFNRSARRAAITRIMKNDKFNKLGISKTGTAFDNLKSNCIEGFAIISSLIASSIIAKRMIVPFIATPLADLAKKKIIDKSPQGNNEPIKNWQPPMATTLNKQSEFSFGQNIASNVVDLYKKIKCNPPQN